MTLQELPLVFALIGLVLYTVLAGADYGAGFWQLVAGGGHRGESVRTATYDAIGPVWEANHVWLVFVLTVVWTAYPTAFGSMASTLTIPLFVAAVGIILRGLGYALHTGSSAARQRRLIDAVFSLSSVLTPFALGTAVGGIASGRVPVGNAAGDLLRSWWNPTSVLLGVLAVVTGAFLAAVYLCADEVRLGDLELARWFRSRALIAGVVAGLVALGGLVVVRSDAPALFRGLTGGYGLIGLIVSAVAGVATLALVLDWRFGSARLSAALAVAGILAGWALAQRPVFLPGLTVAQAAAPTATIIAVVVAVLGGAVILFPSLAVLFRLVLGGRLDSARAEEAGGQVPRPPRRPPRRSLVVAGGCLVAGFALLTVAEPGWAHAVGVVLLLAFMAIGTFAVVPVWTERQKHPGGRS